MEKTFYSNGKLLITGEYLVLDGAKAFALPTKFGQDLIVDSGTGKQIKWTSYDKDGSVWFDDLITFSSIISGETLTDSIKSTLIDILHQAYRLNPEFIDNSDGYIINTRLTFPKMWGLGTSSTLINNLAQWLGIDAFELLQNSYGGSGYDIACAQNDSAILYRLENDKPTVQSIGFKPSFTSQLYFVYLNKKQSSKAAIATYYSKQHNIHKTIPYVDGITTQIVDAKEVGAFCHALETHESLISEILEMRTAKEEFFPDFNGTIKSLGAWGGDFVLAVSDEDPTPYFEKRGFGTVLSYSEMIL